MSRRRFEQYRARLRERLQNRDNRQQRSESDTGFGKEAGRVRSFGELFRAFWGLLRGYRHFVLFALTTLTIATLLKLAPPVGLKIAIDYVLTDQPVPDQWAPWVPAEASRFTLLLMLGGTIALITVLATAIHFWGRWYATKTVNLMQVSLRRRAFEQAMRLPLHRVHALKSGGAASLLREDAGGAAELVFSMLYNPWRAIVQLFGSLAVLVIVDWRMMVGGLILLPVVYATHRTWIRRIRPLWRDVRSQRQHIDGTSTESFGGIRIVRGFGRQRTESARFVRENDLLVRQQLFAWWWSRIIDVIWELLIPLASTALLLYGGYRILEGSMTLGDLTMFLFYLAMLLDPLATLVASAALFQNNLAGLDRVLDLLQEPREMPSSKETIAIIPSRVQGRITLEQVEFQYPGSDRPVLQGIDLDVEAGQTLALVGRSGAGKTTLCNLVARFYDATRGVVRLDGRDVRNIRVESYRRILGIVEQDVFLFDGTIADNIGYGRRGARRDEIRGAARAARANEFIEQLDQGYETLIGERGVKLSGGQRQRLAIARALLADPRILILDEATSNLDSESERLIQKSLRHLMQGRTCFVIAHRMSTIMLADRIALLDQGRLVAVGRHEELLAVSPLYRRMVDLQTLDTPASAGERL